MQYLSSINIHYVPCSYYAQKTVSSQNTKGSPTPKFTAVYFETNSRDFMVSQDLSFVASSGIQEKF